MFRHPLPDRLQGEVGQPGWNARAPCGRRRGGEYKRVGLRENRVTVAQVNVKSRAERPRRRIARRGIILRAAFAQDQRQNISAVSEIQIPVAHDRADRVQLHHIPGRGSDNGGGLAEREDFGVGRHKRRAQGGRHRTGSLEIHSRHQAPQAVGFGFRHRGAGLKRQRRKEDFTAAAAGRPAGRRMDAITGRRVFGEDPVGELGVQDFRDKSRHDVGCAGHCAQLPGCNYYAMNRRVCGFRFFYQVSVLWR